MIPKIIHYVWVGGNLLPPLAEKCIESWKKYCPDYKIIKWDETNFDITSNQYCKEAHKSKKFAFVSDYIRLFALVNHGGVYMDTDVELIKPIDEFLKHQAFSGFENETYISTCVMACEKNFPFFRDLLTEYADRKFILTDGNMNLTSNVTYITETCLHKGLILNNCLQSIDGFTIYPGDYFCPKSYETGKLSITENTCSIHHYDASWLSEKEHLITKKKQKIYAVFGVNPFSKIIIIFLYISERIKEHGIINAFKYYYSRYGKS
jgi:mannosyltransferase OCH1-like enzyme